MGEGVCEGMPGVEHKVLSLVSCCSSRHMGLVPSSPSSPSVSQGNLANSNSTVHSSTQSHSH